MKHRHGAAGCFTGNIGPRRRAAAPPELRPTALSALSAVPRTAWGKPNESSCLRSRRSRGAPRPARPGGDHPVQGRRAQRGVHHHRPSGQEVHGPGDGPHHHRQQRAEGRGRRRCLRRPVRAAALHARPLQPPHPRLRPGRGHAARRQGQPRRRRHRQGRRQRGRHPRRRPALPPAAGRHRRLHAGSALRRPARHRGPHVRRGHHPRPRHLRRAGRRGGRDQPLRPGPDPGRLPDPGHHHRRLLPGGPGPSRGRPRQAGGRHRRGDRQARLGAGPPEGRRGNRHRRADLLPEAGRDQGGDGGGRRQGQRRRSARRGRPSAGSADGAGEGGRAPGRADRPRARHQGA